LLIGKIQERAQQRKGLCNLKRGLLERKKAGKSMNVERKKRVGSDKEPVRQQTKIV